MYDLINDWVVLDTKAKSDTKQDICMYKFFLEELVKSWTKLYPTIKNPTLSSIIGDGLKEASCKLKEIHIKYEEIKK